MLQKWIWRWTSLAALQELHLGVVAVLNEWQVLNELQVLNEGQVLNEEQVPNEWQVAQCLSPATGSSQCV